MRVRNKTDGNVHVDGYGNLPPGEEATVQNNQAVKDMIKADVLGEVKSTSGSSGGNDSNGGDS